MSEEKPIEQMTVEEAKGEIDRRLEDFESDYWQNEKPGHRRAVDEMRRLHEVAFPQKGAEPHDNLADQLEKEGIRTVEDVEKIAAEKKKGNDEDELTPEEKEALDGLKNEWGEEYEGNIGIAQKTYETVATQYGDDEFRALMDKEGLGNNPTIIKLFHKVGAAQEAYEKEAKEALSNFTCPHCGEKIADKEE